MLSFLLSIIEQEYHDQIIYVYKTFEQELLNYTESKLQYAYREKVHSLKEDTEDIVYNALATIALSIKDVDFDRSYAEIRAYVYTILNREMYDYYAYEDQIIELDNDTVYSTDDDFVQKLIIEEENRFIKNAIRALPEPYDSTLYLRYIEKMSVEQIAKITNKAPSTIYSRLATGKDLLEVYLKNKGVKINE